MRTGIRSISGYRVDGPVLVYDDPKKPSEALLEIGVPPGIVLVALFATGFFAIAYAARFASSLAAFLLEPRSSGVLIEAVDARIDRRRQLALLDVLAQVLRRRFRFR